jgi:hypothetical protein
MIVLLLSLVFSGIYCFVAWRWTKRLPDWVQRLVRSYLFGLLCPPLFVHQEAVNGIPSIFLMTFGWSYVKPDGFESLLIQSALSWGAIYFLWIIISGISSPHPDNPAGMRRIKLSAMICSSPSWVFIVDVILYRIWIDGKEWPDLKTVLIPGCVCFICSLASMTLFLIYLNEHWTGPSDGFLFLWAAFPVCLGMGFVFFLLHFSSLVDQLDDYGRNTNYIYWCRSSDCAGKSIA